MLAISVKKEGTVVHVHLTGTISETAQFNEYIGEDFKELHVHCEGVSRINSLGVRAWRIYFGDLKEKSVRLKFYDVTPPLVAQLNLLLDFIHVEDLVSLITGYFCEKCAEVTLVPFTIEEIRECMLTGFKAKSCKACGESATLDEILDHFFSFMKRLPADGPESFRYR